MKKTILTCALAGMSFAPARANDGNKSSIKSTNPTHTISIGINHQTKENTANTTKSITGVDLKYGHQVFTIPITRKTDAISSKFAWGAAIDINRIKAESTSYEKYKLDIMQFKVYLMANATIQINFNADGDCGFGIHVPMGVGINSGTINGTTEISPVDKKTYNKKFIVRPGAFIEPQLFLKYKVAEIFAGINITTGYTDKVTLKSGERRPDMAIHKFNHQTNFIAGIRIYIPQKSR